MTTGRIHSYETLAGLDGPGMRTVVFLQGCPYRCGYCHNPDTWCTTDGTEVTVEDVMTRIRRYRPYHGDDGGVTLSGGEPLLQASFAAEILEACAREGIHSALDTAGHPLNDDVVRALNTCSLVILDVKHADPDRFHELTGGAQQGMRDVLAWTRTHVKPTWIRQVIVPGWNDTGEDVLALAALIKDHPRIERVELVPYHDMARHKWDAAGTVSRFAGTPPMPPEALLSLQKTLDCARDRY